MPPPEVALVPPYRGLFSIASTSRMPSSKAHSAAVSAPLPEPTTSTSTVTSCPLLKLSYPLAACGSPECAPCANPPRRPNEGSCKRATPRARASPYAVAAFNTEYPHADRADHESRPAELHRHVQPRQPCGRRRAVRRGRDGGGSGRLAAQARAGGDPGLL